MGVGTSCDQLLWPRASIVHVPDVMFVWVEAEHPSQQFFSHVGTKPTLPGFNQYCRELMCLAQELNTVLLVGIEPRTSDALSLCHRNRKNVFWKHVLDSAVFMCLLFCPNSKPRCSTSGRKSSQKTISESNGGVVTVGEFVLSLSIIRCLV